MELSMNVKAVLGEAHTYIDMQYEGVDGGWTEKAKADKEEEMYYGDFNRHPLFQFPENAPKYYLPELMTGSDYSGGSLTVSNCRVFLEKFKEIDGVHKVYGGYDTYSVAIREDCLENEDILEVLSGLYDYPLIDEEDMSMVEIECEDENWESWIKSDFQHELHKVYDNEEDETNYDVIDALPSLELEMLFNKLMERGNIYYEHETGCNVGVNIDRVVAELKDGDIKGLVME